MQLSVYTNMKIFCGCQFGSPTLEGVKVYIRPPIYFRAHRRRVRQFEQQITPHRNHHTTSINIVFYLTLQNVHWSELIARKEKESDCESLPENEIKRREAVWELFKSECVFLLDHLMVLKHVSRMLHLFYQYRLSKWWTIWCQRIVESTLRWEYNCESIIVLLGKLFSEILD